MKIGKSKILQTRVPALMKGKMVLFDLASLQGKWGIMCCLPPFGVEETLVLNQYHRTVQKEGGLLLGMLPCADPIFDPCLPKAKVLRFPLIADPLRRLQGILGLQGKSSSNRCQNFIFDPKGVIRYHLVHLLNWRGIAFSLEMLRHCQELYPHPQTSCSDTNSSVISLERASWTRVKGVPCI